MINWYYIGKMDYHAPDGEYMKSPIPYSRNLSSEWRLWYMGWLSEHLMGYWCFKCNKAAIDCDGSYNCNVLANYNFGNPNFHRPFRDGYQAFHDGFDTKENPYIMGGETGNYEKWLEGWNEAQYIYNKSRTGGSSG